MLNTRVLIIDDDEDDQWFFTEALEKALPNSELLSATDGASGITILRDAAHSLPDIIFLDLNMPRMNGWECLHQIRQLPNTSHIPIVIFSTSKVHEHFDHAHRFLNVFYMTKPPRLSDMIQGIQCAVAHNWTAIQELNKTAYA